MTCLIIAKLPCSIILFAFGYAKDRREPEYGRFAAGRDEDKIVIAQQLSTAAEEFYDIDGDRASGAKLLGVHLEAQTFSGPQARRIAATINHRYSRAIVPRIYLCTTNGARCSSAGPAREQRRPWPRRR